MKKYLLSAAMMLMATLASAQFYTAPAGVVKHAPNTTLKTVNKVVKLAPMKTLGENQVYLGPYTTDEVASKNEGLGLTAKPGQLKVGALLSSDMLKDYTDCKIVGIRVGLADAAGDVIAFAKPVNGQSIGKDILDVTISDTKQGWNQTSVTTDYKIGSDDQLLIGFQYTQTASNYPISAVGTGYEGSFLLYADLGYGEGWYSQGSTYGCVSVQLIVENENGFAKNDAAMDGITVPDFIKAGQDFSILVGTHAKFGATFKSVEYGVKLNGTEVATFNNISSTTGQVGDVTSTTGSFFTNANFTADQLKPVGEDNTLSVYVKSVDGGEPANTDDDEISTTFKTYSESLQHQGVLVEHFTSQYCMYCPIGIQLLEKIKALRPEIAWVSLHGNMQTGNDIYTLDDAAYIMEYSASGFPSASFNRFFVPTLYSGPNDGALACGLGYNTSYHDQVAKMFSSIIDLSEEYVPAFAAVDLATSYNEETRKLEITVSGDAVENAQKLLGDDAKLTVYLTEDGLVSRQLNESQKWISKFTHDNVLRKIVTDWSGDNINWNGNKYENKYEVTIPSDQNYKNMHVVAFINRPVVYNATAQTFETALDKAWVNNTNSVKVGETTGIDNAIVDNVNNSEVARYSLDGMQLSAPQKGLNIVRLSDGRTVKVMVK